MSNYRDAMYRRSQRCLAKLRDLYAKAKHFHQTHDTILAGLSAIRLSNDYRKLSPYYLGVFDGHLKCLGDEMYQHLEWRLSYNGKLVRSEDVPKGEWHRVNGDAGRHVYKADPTKIY